MFNIFKKRVWHVVAFDPGYRTLAEKDNPDSGFAHQVTFEKSNFGERRLNYTDSGYELSAAQRHTTLNSAKHLWIEKGRLQITDKADVYDDDYEMVTSASSRVRYWDYKPVTEVDKLMKQLASSPEFQELAQNQKVVFGPQQR